MPELPEVETVCRGLAPAMIGQNVLGVVVRRKNLRIPFPKNLDTRLAGRKITRLSRRAKYILIHLDGGDKGDDVLVIHLGMSGQITIVPNITDYKPAKHDHMIINMGNGVGVVLNDARRFGMVLLEKEKDIPLHSAFALIGPEPLDDDFTGDVLFQRLVRKTINIKNALLDQHVVAGVGNIYASEALHQAGISPLCAAGDIPLKKISLLVDAIKNVLFRAIKAGGSTLKDYKKADGSLGYFQHSFAVYDREGQPCPVCLKNGKKEHVIQKIIQSGRATYFCPHCQK